VLENKLRKNREIARRARGWKVGAKDIVTKGKKCTDLNPYTNAPKILCLSFFNAFILANSGMKKLE